VENTQETQISFHKTKLFLPVLSASLAVVVLT